MADSTVGAPLEEHDTYGLRFIHLFLTTEHRDCGVVYGSFNVPLKTYLGWMVPNQAHSTGLGLVSHSQKPIFQRQRPQAFRTILISYQHEQVCQSAQSYQL